MVVTGVHILTRMTGDLKNFAENSIVQPPDEHYGLDGAAVYHGITSVYCIPEL